MPLVRVFGSGLCDEVLAVPIDTVPELRAPQRADPLRPRRHCRDAPFAMTTVRRGVHEAVATIGSVPEGAVGIRSG